MKRTSRQIDLDDRRRQDAYARAEMRREVERTRAEDDEHERILNECRTPAGGRHALVAVLEPGRIDEDARVLAAERDFDRLIECGAES